MQGFVPAMIVREPFVRRNLVVKSWRSSLTVRVPEHQRVLRTYRSGLLVMTGLAGDAFWGRRACVGYTVGYAVRTSSGATVTVTRSARTRPADREENPSRRDQGRPGRKCA